MSPSNSPLSIPKKKLSNNNLSQFGKKDDFLESISKSSQYMEYEDIEQQSPYSVTKNVKFTKNTKTHSDKDSQIY